MPAEDCAPEQVEHGAVLGDLRGRDQDIEDDPGLASVHDVVDLVAEPAAGFRPGGHRGGVGVGFRCPRVGGSLTVAALKRAVLPSSPGDPVALGGVVLYEPLILGRGQLRDLVTFLGDVFLIDLRRVRLFFLEEFLQMGLQGPPRCQGVHRGVRFDLGSVEEQLLAPYQPRLEAHLDYLLEEASEDL